MTDKEIIDKQSIRERREAIMALEQEMRESDLEPHKCVTTHHFSKGIYARELKIPAGTLLTGEIHKHENLNILSQGDISILTEEGFKRVQAPYTVVSPPGVKRVGFAHTDVVWTTIHATEKTDVDEIREEVIAKSFDEVEQLISETNKQIKGGE